MKQMMLETMTWLSLILAVLLCVKVGQLLKRANALEQAVQAQSTNEN